MPGITRRHFFAAGIGIGVKSLCPWSQMDGIQSPLASLPPTELERYLANNPCPQILGWPRDWSLVRQLNSRVPGLLKTLSWHKFME